MTKILLGLCLTLSISINAYAQSNEAPSLPDKKVDSVEEKKENVSTLNNQLVPVGEKNKYVYDYKKFNIGMNLFVLPTEIISISGSYAITLHVVARAGLSKDFSSRGWGLYKTLNVNAGVPLYFQKAYSGFFVEPGIDSGSGFYVAGGYHWMWDSGFNTHIGMGVGSRGAVGQLQVSYAFGD